MTPATLNRYAPCPQHRLWHDTESECFYCLVERADNEPLPNPDAMADVQHAKDV